MTLLDVHGRARATEAWCLMLEGQHLVETGNWEGSAIEDLGWPWLRKRGLVSKGKDRLAHHVSAPEVGNDLLRWGYEALVKLGVAKKILEGS